MCQYQYVKYGICEHSVIECRELCGVALWRAGATGKLVLCVPSIVGRPMQESGPKHNDSLQYTEFLGFTGSCNACIKELQLHDNIRLRDDQFDYITISEGQLSPDAVFYFQVDQLLTTFPHLLAIDQHLTQANMDLGPAILFPEATEKLTWAILRTQQPYQVSGFWAMIDGPKSVGELLDQLQCPSGLSLQDRQMFIHVLKNNLDVNQFYKDVFMSRGMPYSVFSRLCAQIRHKAMRIEQQKAERAAMATNPQLTSSRSASLSGAFQNMNSGVAGGNHAEPEREGSAVSLAPASLTQPNVQHTDAGRFADNTSLQQLGDPDQGASDAAGSKRSFSTMQEDTLEDAGSSSNAQQSYHDQEDSERPAQRARLSEPEGPSALDNGTSQVQNATTGFSPELTMNTAESEAGSNVSPAALSSALPTPMPQQPFGERPVGQFDLAACRAMQEQARAAEAVPMQPFSAAVAQTQAAAQAFQAQAVQADQAQVVQTQLEADQAQADQAHAVQAPAVLAPAVQAQAVQAQIVQAQAPQAHALQAPAVQASAAQTQSVQLPAAQLPAAQLPTAQAPTAQAQPPLPRAQLVDTSRDEFLQAQVRQCRAPHKMAANRARASRFTSAFSYLVESGGLMAAAAHAGIHLTVGEVEKILESQKILEALRAQEDESQASSPSTSQSSLDPSLVDPSLIDQSAAIQSPSTPTTTQQSPQDSSATTTPSTGAPTTAASSPTSQPPTLANTENIPGKGKGVLPHVVAKARFFLNDQERDLAADQLTSAWTAYRDPSETPIAKEQAALWIVNFSLNFRQQWTMFADSFGSIKDTTLAQLRMPYSGVLPNIPNSPALSVGADLSQPQEDSNIGENQTPQFQHTMHVEQAQNEESGTASASDSQLDFQVLFEGSMISGLDSDVNYSNDAF